jgi:hypothetical protein
MGTHTTKRNESLCICFFSSKSAGWDRLDYGDKQSRCRSGAFATLGVDSLQTVKLTSELPDALVSLLGVCIGLIEIGVKRKYQTGGWLEGAIREDFHDLLERRRSPLPIGTWPKRI